MIIEQSEIFPFEVLDVCIRQKKARDGESEGGWRLDLVAKNVGDNTRSKLEISLRYFDKDQKFVGLDKQSLWKDDYIKQDEVKDFSFYIEPPNEAEKVELRIQSKIGLPTWVNDPPVWLIFLFVFIVVGIFIVIQQLT